jgi:hypothetical protein
VQKPAAPEERPSPPIALTDVTAGRKRHQQRRSRRRSSSIAAATGFKNARPDLAHVADFALAADRGTPLPKPLNALPTRATPGPDCDADHFVKL